MIKLSNVTKNYISKQSKERISALNGVTCDFTKTGMVFILGKSGSGKSTLLNVISGLDDFDEGSIEVGGKKLEKFSESEINNYRSNNVGFIFQDFILINTISVYDNINLALTFQNISSKNELIHNALKSVGLENFSTRFPYELSGGEKQRVAIARALVRNPKIIFADEPTGNLDSETGNQILEILKKLSKNTLVFVVTHDTESCKLYADRMLGLKDGKIDYDKIINSENLCRKSDNIEILTKSQHIPNKVSISIAYSNFKTRILRSMISILLFCTALISLTCTMSLFFYSTNDGVYLTAKNNQAEYLHFYNTELDRYGNATKSFTYLNRLYVENISSNTLFEMIPNRGNKALILGGTSKYALNNKIEVDSVNDLIAYGLKFHDDYFLEFNDDRVVINDFSFQIMKDETRQFFENIYIPQYIFYLVENGSEIPLYLSSYDYGDMVGKEIKVYSPIDEDNQLFMDSFEVSGIYITNYLDYVDANFDLRHNLTDDEMNNWIMMWNHVYKTYVSKGYSDLHRYLPGTFYAEETNLISLDSTQFNLRNYTLQIENSTNLYENNISIGMFDYISNRYFILGNDDIITTEYELKNDEIFINLDIYNILNNTSYQPIDFIENGSIISYPNLDGMNMSIKIQDRDLSRQVYEKNYKIIGVFIDEDEQYSADSIWMSVYVNDLNANDLTKIYLTVYSVISVYVGNDYANLPKLIKEFSDEGMLPDFDYSNSFYALESGIRQAQTLMLIISIASLVTAIIMITNVISVSINSKKKEIGILRAIGYSGGHVSAIFLYESILLGFITLIIVLGLQPVIVKILNLVIAKADYQYVKFFSVEIITGLILFTITILIPVVSTVYPIYRISKLKPAECIRKVE